MPYEMDWYIPERIILVRLWGIHTLEETVQLSTDILERTTSVDEPVHVVIDGHKLKEIPSNLNAVIKAVNGMRHPKIGYVVNVGDHNIFIQFMMRAVSRIMRIDFQLVNTVPQAFDFLKKYDNSIDWSQANHALVSSEAQVS